MQIKTQNYHVYIALKGKMFAERCANAQGRMELSKKKNAWLSFAKRFEKKI